MILATVLAVPVNASELAAGTAPAYLETEKRPAILMYHAFGDDERDTFVATSVFEEQMKYLSENGYTYLFPEEIHDSDAHEKPILITFDDGYRCNYTEAFPILLKYNVKVAIFLITDRIGEPDTPGRIAKLTKEQIAEMSDSGLVQFYSHMHSHRNLVTLTAEEIREEIEMSNAIIQELTGRTPRVICYPGGGYNDEVLDIMREHFDIGFATTMPGGERNMLQLTRPLVTNDMEEFKKHITVTYPEIRPPGQDSGPMPTLAATPAFHTVLVNGEETVFDAYTINGNNYFKLRDLAYALNGTEKQFEVNWDAASNTIFLVSGECYTVIGGEMAGKGAGNKTPVPIAAKIYIDGRIMQFNAYNIDGNNYFKLRDIGQAFDFGVSWDGAKNTITIDTGKGYIAE